MRKRMRAIAAGFGLTIAMMLTVSMESRAQENHKDYSEEELYQAIDGIVRWKKDSLGQDMSENLMTDDYLRNVGNTQGDWYPLCLSRLGLPDDYAAYRAVVNETVTRKYQTEEKLDAVKATEWHRIALAYLACGGDPTDVGEQHINLIADGVYNRGETLELGAQGVNGVIWGLIALDSQRFAVPDAAFQTREDILLMLLESQLADGGFAFGGSSAEPDITAMALTALSPYYNSEETYTYTRKATGETVTRKVREAADEALACLSAMQADDGSFSDWGMENSESASQILMALSSLGIDAQKDERFVKNGVTVLDVLMGFRMSDGGFIHSRTYDEENPDADPEKSNTLAGEQALYALISYVRFREGLRNFYDLRPEMEEAVRSQIESVNEEIGALSGQTLSSDGEAVRRIFEEYKKIPVPERCYVRGYEKLAGGLEALGIENDSEFLAGAMELAESGRGTVTDIRNPRETLSTDAVFGEKEKEEAEAIPQEVTTEHKIAVLKAIYRIEQTGNEASFGELLNSLKEKREVIENREDEIASINEAICENISPSGEESVDGGILKSIMSRYEALSDYEKTQIENYEDVEKAAMQASNRTRALLLGTAVGSLVVLLSAVLLIRGRKRRKERRNRKMLDWENEEDEDDDRED